MSRALHTIIIVVRLDCQVPRADPHSLIKPTAVQCTRICH